VHGGWHEHGGGQDGWQQGGGVSQLGGEQGAEL
jgi:hypothetical protein